MRLQGIINYAVDTMLLDRQSPGQFKPARSKQGNIQNKLQELQELKQTYFIYIFQNLY